MHCHRNASPKCTVTEMPPKCILPHTSVIPNPRIAERSACGVSARDLESSIGLASCESGYQSWVPCRALNAGAFRSLARNDGQLDVGSRTKMKNIHITRPTYRRALFNRSGLRRSFYDNFFIRHQIKLNFITGIYTKMFQHIFAQFNLTAFVDCKNWHHKNMIQICITVNSPLRPDMRPRSGSDQYSHHSRQLECGTICRRRM
jgi:hypothetical protein